MGLEYGKPGEAPAKEAAETKKRPDSRHLSLNKERLVTEEWSCWAFSMAPMPLRGVTMADSFPTPAPADGSVPTLLAADLQDHLMTASNDLDRLQRLLADATTTLLAHFHGLSDQIDSLRTHLDGPARIDPAAIEQALQALGGAVIALQFQDMASQLISHTDLRLRSCADRLARDALDDDDGAPLTLPAPLRPNPVTQDEVDAGSVELF
jgi:hypothetical protein